MSGLRIMGLCGLTFAAALLPAGTPAAMQSGRVANFSATSANVAGAPDSIRIDILRWSTEEECERLMSAWSLKRGGGNAGPMNPGARRPGGPAASGPRPLDTAPPSPEAALAAALKETSTVGYLWAASEVAGYALRFARKVPGPNGLDRIILITHRRLGAMNELWKPAGEGAPAKYDFSVIELRVNANGEGEGRASLSGKVAPDSAVEMIALENYDALPVVLSGVKSRIAGLGTR